VFGFVLSADAGVRWRVRTPMLLSFVGFRSGPMAMLVRSRAVALLPLHCRSSCQRQKNQDV
jgi:hypothetical protein